MRWHQPIGGGYASFVVADGRAFTIEQRRRREVVAGYDVATGRELWTHAWDAYFTESMGGDGPRATPTWDDGRVYALGVTGEFRCLDAETGRLIWKHNILTDNQAGNLSWVMAASPLIVDDKVIVLPGRIAGSVGRCLPQAHGRGGLDVIERWASIHRTDAGDAGRSASDSRGQCAACDGSRGRRWIVAVGLPLADPDRSQHRPAGRAQRESSLPIG